MPSQRTTLHIRLRPEAAAELEDLILRTGLQKTEVIHLAIHCASGFEFTMNPDPEKPRYNPETEQYEVPKKTRKKS